MAKQPAAPEPDPTPNAETAPETVAAPPNPDQPWYQQRPSLINYGVPGSAYTAAQVADGGEDAKAAANEGAPRTYVQDWTWTTSSTAPPSANQVRTDVSGATGWSAATKLWIDYRSLDGVDRSAGLNAINALDVIVMTKKSDPTVWASWTVSAPVDKGGYVEYGLTWKDGAGAVATNNTTVSMSVTT
jgi:hypothetical protein